MSLSSQIVGVREATTHIYGFVPKTCMKSSAISEHMFSVQSIITDSPTILRMGGKTHNVTTTEHRYAKAVHWFWQHLSKLVNRNNCNGEISIHSQ